MRRTASWLVCLACICVLGTTTTQAAAPQHERSLRLYVSKLLSFRGLPASWSACEFAVRPAPGLLPPPPPPQQHQPPPPPRAARAAPPPAPPSARGDARVEAALQVLGRRSLDLGSNVSFFSGTAGARLLYGAIVFNNLTTADPRAAAAAVCGRVAVALRALPAAYFAQPTHIGRRAVLEGVYDPLDPDGLFNRACNYMCIKPRGSPKKKCRSCNESIPPPPNICSCSTAKCSLYWPIMCK